jgi:hypothetical protein
MRGVSDQRPVTPARRWPAARHLLLSILLWLTYVLYWRVVLHRGIESEARLSGILLGLFVLLQGLSTLGWILHNRRLEKRHRGRRRQRPRAARAPSRDFVGRSLEDYPAGVDLRRAQVVVVRVDGDRKRFETGLPLDGDRRAQA